jgi:hypothetical protein
MAVSVTYLELEKSIMHWLARGKRIALGTLTVSTYTGAGIGCSITALNNLEAVFISNTDGRFYVYNHSTSKLNIYGMSTSTLTFEVASDTEAACFTAPMFLAVGRD